MTANSQPLSKEGTKTSLKDLIRKILLLSILLAIVINIGVTYFTTGPLPIQADAPYESVEAPYIGDTGVAIALNIGLKNEPTKRIPVELTEEILPISELLSNPDLARQRLITKHMLFVQDYLNILRTNIPQLLNRSPDKSVVLESFIDQLQYRYKSALQNSVILKSQVRQLEESVIQSQADIATAKKDLETAYGKMDTEKVEEQIARYLEARNQVIYAQTYALFLNKSLAQYVALNEYNKLLLDTLINNREALIKNATVVLPDSGTGLLKKLNLIRTESEYKSAQ